MALHAIRPRSLSEQVFEQLATEIITGHWLPGTNLPAERTLTGVFDVNRHVVREALKRLEQVGLVKVSQGGGTKVLDFKRHAGLDLLALMSEHSRVGDDVAAIWLSVLEMRATIAADLVRLCALRASDEVKKELVAIARTMKDTTSEAELFALDVRFWERMADGAGNIAYRLALNTMVRSAQTDAAMAVQWTIIELKENEYRQPLAAAIGAGNATKAETMTRDAMRAAVDRFAASLGLTAKAAWADKPREPPRDAPPARGRKASTRSGG